MFVFCLLNVLFSKNNNKINLQNYKKLLQERLIPNLTPHLVVVTDNALYYKTQLYSAPTSRNKRTKVIIKPSCVTLSNVIKRNILHTHLTLCCKIKVILC